MKFLKQADGIVIAKSRLRSGVLSLAASLFVLSVFYTQMFQRYRSYDIDNPWFLSFSYNLSHHGTSTDYLMNGVFPDGMGGTIIFGKLAALLQAAILNRLGWFPSSALTVGVSLTIGAYVVWWCFLKELKFSVEFRTAFLITMGLLEPFVSMATKFRYEYVSFLLMSLSLLLASKGRAFAALLLAFVSLETEPSAIVVCLVTSTFLLLRYGNSRRLNLQFAGALVIAVGMYLTLHPDAVDVLHGLGSSRAAAPPSLFGGFVRAYFIQRKRHFAELVMVLLIAHRCWTVRLNYTFAQKFTLIASLEGLAVSMAMEWPNPAYMVFMYPFVIALGLDLFSTRFRLKVLVALVIVSSLPGYVYLFWTNRKEGYERADMMAVSSAIGSVENSLGLRDDNARIYGDEGIWYAHPDHYRALSRTTEIFMTQANVFVCYEAPIIPTNQIDANLLYCPDVRSHVAVSEAAMLLVHGHMLHILVPERIDRKE